jgi:hypothetical protein
MFNKSKQRVFIPMMLMGFLCFGAVAAEARDYRHEDQVKKDAAIGAVVGTLVQVIGGRTEGHELLKGAVVGGALGAAVGAAKESRRGYYRDGYYRDGHYRDGYYDRDGYYSRDGYYQDGYYSSDGTYRYDDRYDRRTSHRHDRRCRH